MAAPLCLSWLLQGRTPSSSLPPIDYHYVPAPQHGFDTESYYTLRVTRALVDFDDSTSPLMQGMRPSLFVTLRTRSGDSSHSVFPVIREHVPSSSSSCVALIPCLILLASLGLPTAFSWLVVPVRAAVSWIAVFAMAGLLVCLRTSVSSRHGSLRNCRVITPVVYRRVRSLNVDDNGNACCCWNA